MESFFFIGLHCNHNCLVNIPFSATFVTAIMPAAPMQLVVQQAQSNTNSDIDSRIIIVCLVGPLVMLNMLQIFVRKVSFVICS